MKRLPIGIQDFRTIREENYIYVDKTKDIHYMIENTRQGFFSRPRRFGKSLLINTLKELFKGNKELFEGLYIYDKISWVKYPVIHVDFNAMNYKSNPLADEIDKSMEKNAKENGIELIATDYKNKFIELLDRLHKEQGKVVVLIDEYDKAITDFLGEEEKVNENISVLKNFYSTLKSADGHIHFSLITGVSKYGKVSIFSDLNNLDDLTLNRRCTTIAGITKEELQTAFSKHLESLCQEMNFTHEELIQRIKLWYNGYSWDGKNSVYNPFSLLNFLKEGQLQNYWFTTGTPSFLIKLLRKQRIPAYQLEQLQGATALLESSDVNDIELLPLLFQTGYLTIINVKEIIAGRLRYTLSYPNEEVRQSFTKNILAGYLSKPVAQTESEYIIRLTDTLLEKDLEEFFNISKAIFDGIPYGITAKQEEYFHSVMHVILTLTGMRTHSEVQTSKGRMDSVVESPDTVYIFEFKINTSAEEALSQIDEKGYGKRFAVDGKALVKIGVNFDTESKNISEWIAI